MSNVLVRLIALAALGVGSLMAVAPAFAECAGHAAQTVASTPAQTPAPATTASAVRGTKGGS